MRHAATDKKPIINEIRNIHPVIMPKVLNVVEIGTLISCGFNNPAEDYFKEPVNLAEMLVRNQTTTFMGTAWNDSMEPLVYEGSILLVDTSLEVRNGHFVAGTYAGEWFMKRYWKDPDGTITLHSENDQKYKPVTVQEGIQFKIFGRVTWFMMGV